MMHKASSSREEVPYCLIRSSVKFQGHTAIKIVEFTNGYKMMHKVQSSIEEMPYCFLGSSVKFLGHTDKKIVDFDPNWAFPECNSSLNSPMGMKCCTRAWSSIEKVPYYFARSSVKFQGRTAKKIVEFDPDWVFLDCNSSLNSPIATKWCTKLEVA